MSAELIFEDPPGSNRSGSDLSGWVRSLRDHPGIWAKYPLPMANPGTTAYRIRSGLLANTDRGEFEAAARTIDGDQWLYARYVGGQS